MADTNGVSTFRTKKGEEVFSVADQYIARAGISHAMPKVRNMTVTFGGRIEGVPVRDLLGKSNGFRRPGYAISADPGFMYVWKSHLFPATFRGPSSETGGAASPTSRTADMATQPSRITRWSSDTRDASSASSPGTARARRPAGP